MQDHLDFGEVHLAITNPYQPADLSLPAVSSPLPSSPPATGNWVIDYDNGLGTVIDCGQDPT